MEYVMAGFAFWVLCGWLAYGRVFAYLQRKWPELAQQERQVDRERASIIAIFGPFGLVVSLFGSMGHGFMWRTPMDE